ncbi:hypothetical protein PHJA_000334500 [Phtheirospermum japonicum]|uniref:BHLH domain-containing protein n=1 Tax=Phtheirospermum japonicum TaxID=374723 RepID=A0A830B7V8_9LAMI|nr:hypothetical protein PHJA_000334500 [Phtheirospermum japonicum]
MGDGGKGQIGKQESEEDEIIRLLLGIMEGYKDTVIPPLSYFSPKFPGISNTEMGSSSSLYERKRRAQMSDKYSVLQSMLPTLSDTVKAPKEKIIDNTVNYIKYLEEEKKLLEGLKKIQRKEAKPVLSRCTTNPNSNVKFTASNGATFLEVQLPFKRGSVAKIAEVLEKHGVEVLEARVCVNDDDERLLTFTATVMVACGGDATIRMIREEILLNL